MPTNPIVPKRNSTAGSTTGPSASALLVGELATNTFTGDVFLKLEDNTVANIASANALQTTGGTLTGALTINNGTGVTSIDASGAIEGQSLTVTGAAQVGSVKFPDNTTQTSAALVPFRNFLINGDCRIAQRGSVAAVNGSATYGGCDRIYCLPSGFSTLSSTSITQVSNSGTTTGLGQSVTVTTSGSGTIVFGQRIESLNSRVLNAKTVTVSCKVYHTAGSSVAMQALLYKANSADSFSAVTQVDSTKSAGSVPSATWTSISATFTIGSSDASNGLDVRIMFSGLGALSAKVFAIGDFQLEVGSVATTFETKSVAMELEQCMRYYQSLGEFAGGFTTTAAVRGAIRFFIPMRTAPTISAGTIQAQGVSNISVTSPSLSNTTYLTALFNGTVTGATAGQATRIVTTTGASWLDAEL